MYSTLGNHRRTLFLLLFILIISITIDAQDNVDCYRSSPRRWPKSSSGLHASVSSCKRALLQFPYSTDTTTFHQGGGPDDIYRLSRTRTFEKCQVTITLQGGQQQEQIEERSSWIGINTYATRLLKACNSLLGPGIGQARVGGQVRVGEQGRLLIAIGKEGRIPAPPDEWVY